MNTFAERLKYAMEQADLKQSALSNRPDFQGRNQSVSFREEHPNQERIKALADVTGVTFDFLMGYGAARLLMPRPGEENQREGSGPVYGQI